MGIKTLNMAKMIKIGWKRDRKGQKGTKRDKIFMKTLKMPILMTKLVGKGTKRDIKNQKF